MCGPCCEGRSRLANDHLVLTQCDTQDEEGMRGTLSRGGSCPGRALRTDEHKLRGDEGKGVPADSLIQTPSSRKGIRGAEEQDVPF